MLKSSISLLELHDAVFVVGSLDETIMLRGMRYHPIDIENSVLRCHKKVSEWWVLYVKNCILIRHTASENEKLYQQQALH